MYRTYKAADLVIARAGALTISELTFLGKAMILIPYKYAADNHQEINADSIEKKKACFVIHEDKLKKGILEKQIAFDKWMQEYKDDQAAKLVEANEAAKLVEADETKLVL